MSGATVFDVTQNNTAVHAAFGKQNTTKTDAMAFSDVLHQSSNAKQKQQNKRGASIESVDNTASQATKAYDRYQYKDNKVEEEQLTSISDKISSAKDEIDTFEKNVVACVAEQLDVDTMDVEKVLEELGMSAFELMNPQNLAQVVMQLTDVSNRMELLLDSNFQDLLIQVGEAGSEIMNQLNLQMNEMDELVSQMEVLEQPQTFEQPIEMNEPIIEEKVVLLNEEDLKNQDMVAVNEEDIAGMLSGETEETITAVEKMSDAKQQDGTMSENHSHNSKEDSLLDNHVMHANVQGETVSQQGEPVGDVQTSQLSYADMVDTIDLIHQVAERAKITLSNDVSTMEMQLNPENLGRIYMQISTKEGSVNAQIAAQNETVKEALEMQLATLREQLNQAGIKVDEIEVTVATHEFEKNLEQNQGQNQKEESSGQNNKNSGRRSLRMDSMDELSGLMTEEEQLVAQIMKDNGNSVDFTA